MLVNDLISMLLDIPPVLAGQWGVWFAVGLILSIWGRRERMRLVVHGYEDQHSSGVRHASGVRHSSGVRPTRRPKPAQEPEPGTVDAMSEFEAMLNAQEHEAATVRRTPGEALPEPEVFR